MKIQIIIIGDELLIGQVDDINTGYIARSLNACGVVPFKVSTIHDNKEQIRNTVLEALKDSDLIITTGGLGPTRDDITKEVLTEIFGGHLIKNVDVEANVEAIFARRNIPMNDLTRNQALVPSSCTVIMNEFGTAPVMWFEKNNKVLVSLPGVPSELKGCWDLRVLPQILHRFNIQEHTVHETLIISGISESALAIKLEDFEDKLPDYMHLAYLPNQPYIRLRLDGNHKDRNFLNQVIREQKETLKTILGDLVIADDDLTLPQLLLSLLKRQNYTISVAESCSGGSISAAITSIPGSSKYFKGGVVAYSNDIKEQVLNVSKTSIEVNGVVSTDVVEQMAKGIKRISTTDCAIATSGIAGPDGATPGKPVGTVCIATIAGKYIESRRYQFNGTRTEIVKKTVDASIIQLCKLLESKR